jgi:hypothetical protein
VQSHLLAEALITERDPLRRIARFEALLVAHLRPYHRASKVADQVFHDRAARARGQHTTLLQRLQMYAYERVVLPALASDMVLVREILNVGSMGRPAGPLRIARFALRVVGSWLRGLFGSAPALPSNLTQAELLQLAAAAQQTAATEPDTTKTLDAPI